MEGADTLFERLVTQVAWESERRPMYDRVVDVPRLHFFYGAGDALPDGALDAARRVLDRRYASALPEGFATVGLCLYRDGRDSVAWHGDTVGRGAHEDTVVAILSLGAPRRLMLRPKAGAAAAGVERTHRFEVGGGDLVVMGGTCQRTWEHAVPKTTRPVGPRISVQFRPPGVR